MEREDGERGDVEGVNCERGRLGTEDKCVRGWNLRVWGSDARRLNEMKEEE